MTDVSSRIREELRRLSEGPHPDEKPGGVGTVRFVARCPIGASDVLTKARSLLRIVDEAALVGWPTHEEWLAKLPEWFTSRCAPEQTPEEAEAWLTWWKTLSPDEQARLRQQTEWSLDNWVYWFQLGNRQWFWWDAKAMDDLDHIILAVEVESWPFPWGALRWLFLTAGASALEADE